MNVTYDKENNRYRIEPPGNGLGSDAIYVSPEALGRARYQIPSEDIVERYNNFLAQQAQHQAKKESIMNNFSGSFFTQQFGSFSNNLISPMKRLTTSGDWTILLEANKLVAVNSEGVTIRSTGSFLSADGKAWMWKDGKLWSGILEEHETEEGKRKKIEADIAIKKAERRAKILQKRDEAVRAAHEKYNRLLSDA